MSKSKVLHKSPFFIYFPADLYWKKKLPQVYQQCLTTNTILCLSQFTYNALRTDNTLRTVTKICRWGFGNINYVLYNTLKYYSVWRKQNTYVIHTFYGYV